MKTVYVHACKHVWKEWEGERAGGALDESPSAPCMSHSHLHFFPRVRGGRGWGGSARENEIQIRHSEQEKRDPSPCLSNSSCKSRGAIYLQGHFQTRCGAARARAGGAEEAGSPRHAGRGLAPACPVIGFIYLHFTGSEEAWEV